jgi:hypothetical protein
MELADGGRYRKMKRSIVRIYRKGLAALVLSTMSTAAADNHVMCTADVQSALRRAGATRQGNQADLDHFLAQQKVRDTLKNAGISTESVREKASLLSDDELSTLAAKARSAERDVAGGQLKDAQVTLIILAVAGFAFLAVLVLAFK